METTYLVIIVVVIILLLWVLSPSAKIVCLNELNGFWMADDNFCQESGIDMMCMFFGEHQNDDIKPEGRLYLCWILIINKAGHFNHITTADVLPNGMHIKDDQYAFSIELQDAPNDGDAQLFPTNLRLLTVAGEILTIVDDDENVIFEGTKNHEASKAIEFQINE